MIGQGTPKDYASPTRTRRESDLLIFERSRERLLSFSSFSIVLSNSSLLPDQFSKGRFPMQSKNPLEVNILIVVIAQEGNFIRASKKLGITPPSLTRRVSSLER